MSAGRPALPAWRSLNFWALFVAYPIRMATKKTHEQRARSLYDWCKHISAQRRRYIYGGGHGEALVNIDPHDGLDCSSSTCLALKRAGLYQSRYACVSGNFANWGQSGRGRYFTVWYNAHHVWIEFHHPFGQYKRFDTSPWGFGGRGPRVRKTRRPRYGFKARHYPGM